MGRLVRCTFSCGRACVLSRFGSARGTCAKGAGSTAARAIKGEFVESARPIDEGNHECGCRQEMVMVIFSAGRCKVTCTFLGMSYQPGLAGVVTNPLSWGYDWCCWGRITGTQGAVSYNKNWSGTRCPVLCHPSMADVNCRKQLLGPHNLQQLPHVDRSLSLPSQGPLRCGPPPCCHCHGSFPEHFNHP